MTSRSRNASRRKSLPSRVPRPRADANPSRLIGLEHELHQQQARVAGPVRHDKDMDDHTTPRPAWDRPLADAEVRRQAIEELSRVETDADAEALLGELRDAMEATDE